MIILVLIVGLILGYILRCIIESFQCKHNYVHVTHTEYMKHGKRDYLVKHYECNKCHKVKDVRIG